MNDEYLGTTAPSNADAPQTLLRKIARGIYAMAGGSSGASELAPVSHVFTLVPEQSEFSIPAGAKGWSVTILTGIGYIGGVLVSAGFSDSDDRTTSGSIQILTAVTSTAYVRYGT